MKTAILATVLFAGLSASASSYVTVTVCNGGEAGTECKTISYKVRADMPMATNDQHLNSEDQVQPAARYGVPGWLKALNDAFPANPGSDDPATGAGGPN